MTKRASGLFCVIYMDHVEFKNSNPDLFKPSVRETTGWLTNETDEAVTICYDRPVKALPFENPKGSGFVILKRDILAMKKI